jgi:hypothetical protein
MILIVARKTSDSCGNVEAAKGTICMLTEAAQTNASLNKVIYITVTCLAEKQIEDGE